METFIQLLTANGIVMVVDVRSAPYSRYVSHFNRANLERELPRRGVQYAFAGRELGGRPSDRSLYKKGVLPARKADYLHEVHYPALMQRESFREAIGRLIDVASEQPTAILCSEADPRRCHRHHLIARYLMDEHPTLDVLHILGDGSVSNAAAIQAYLDGPSSGQPTLI